MRLVMVLCRRDYIYTDEMVDLKMVERALLVRTASAVRAALPLERDFVSLERDFVALEGRALVVGVNEMEKIKDDE